MKKPNDISDISSKLIKIGSSKWKSHTAFKFNQCATHEIFPDKLKTAIVYPFHKINSKHHGSNCRPIFILPVFSKKYNWLTEYIDIHTILYEKQFIFQKDKFTQHVQETNQSSASAASYEERILTVISEMSQFIQDSFCFSFCTALGLATIFVCLLCK